MEPNEKPKPDAPPVAVARPAEPRAPKPGTVRLAIVLDGKVDEIVDHRLGNELKRHYDEVVDIAARPDIKVGDPFPPETSWIDYHAATKGVDKATLPYRSYHEYLIWLDDQKKGGE